MLENKEKILMVSCDGLGRGGVQAVMMSIIRNLSYKYTFDVVTFMHGYDFYAEEIKALGGRVIVLPNYDGAWNLRRRADIYMRGIKRYREIKKVIKENGPYKVIHCNNEYEAGICLYAAKKMHIPIRICHVHVNMNNLRLIRRMLNNIYLKLIEHSATQYIACSEIAGRNFYGIHNKFKVILNPYDESKFDKRKYGFQSVSNLMLLQVGSFNNNKNQKFSLDIFKYLKGIYEDAKLIFVGFDVGSGYEKELREYAEYLSIGNSVEFMPWDSNISVLLNKTSYFLFPSKQEGFGIALIEAQAMGVKCYVSDTVPKETDCGGCLYLPLDKGAKWWAEKIINDYTENGFKHEIYDCSAFSEQEVMKSYQSLYGGL